MKIKKPLALLALATAAALALAGCAAGAGSTGDGSAEGSRLRVVATTTQLADFASRIGGDEIQLTGLLQPGGSAHHFDPSPADLVALGRADVLIVNGAGLDEFVDSAIKASGFKGAIVDASDGVDLALAREITLEALDGTAHEHDDHSAEEKAAADDHDHDHDHDHAKAGDGHGDHDHGDLNPHLWTSVRFAQDMVHEIGHGLGDASPANAKLFADRAHEYMHQLEELDRWIGAQFKQVPQAQRVLVTGHDSMRYYLHDYDIAFAGSLLPSFEDNAEPSAAEIDALVAAIKARGVKAIFVESSLNPKIAARVAADAGVTVADADALFVDSLGPAGSGAESYVSATVHNTRVILEAWGVKPAPLPQELERL